MSKTYRQAYDDRMRLALTMTKASGRLLVEDTIQRIRKDKNVKPLTLCAFLQDHAKLIRETYNSN